MLGVLFPQVVCTVAALRSFHGSKHGFRWKLDQLQRTAGYNDISKSGIYPSTDVRQK